MSIVADNVQFIGPRESGDAGGQRPPYQSRQQSSGSTAPAPGPVDGPWPGDTSEPDDDIPF